MKNLRLLIVIFLAAAVLVSCEKKMGVEDMFIPDAKVKGSVVVDNFMPVSTFDVPEIITAMDGKNRGGNRTCCDVGYFYGYDFLECGDKVDYEDFDGGFPDGLVVTVNESTKRLSFYIEGGCLDIDGSSYKVGAVIVKGSNAANVYFYMTEDDQGVWSGGVTSDVNLGSPGGKALVSNLTFCFVPCEGDEEDPEKIIAVKVKTEPGTEGQYAITNTGGTYIQCVPYVLGASYKIYLNSDLSEVGDLIIGDDGSVTINNADNASFLMQEAYVLIAPVGGCSQDYWDYPYQKLGLLDLDEVIFTTTDLGID